MYELEYLERKPHHAGRLAWSNWNLEMLVFVEGTEENQRTQRKPLGER